MRITRNRLPAVSILLFAVLSSACATGNRDVPESGTPDLSQFYPVPELSPEEIVGIQLAAFQSNGDDDNGIRIAFRFASPSNRLVTGTEERFAELLRTGPYRPMLNSTSFEVRPVDSNETAALVAVRIESADLPPALFVFILIRQIGGIYDQCWMTDSVLPYLPQTPDPETLPDVAGWTGYSA